MEPFGVPEGLGSGQASGAVEVDPKISFGVNPMHFLWFFDNFNAQICQFDFGRQTIAG